MKKYLFTLCVKQALLASGINSFCPYGGNPIPAIKNDSQGRLAFKIYKGFLYFDRKKTHLTVEINDVIHAALYYHVMA